MTKSKKQTTSSATSMNNTKLTFWTIGVIALCVLGFILMVMNKEDKPSKSVAIDYTNQPFLGKEDAKVSIIEFGDYKCPSCKNFTQSSYPDIKTKLIDTGKVKFYFMNDTIVNVDTDSTRSALFAEAVYQQLGNEAFWKFHENLYKNQPEDPNLEKADYFTEKLLTDILKETASAEEIQKVVTVFKDKKAADALKKDMDYVKQLNVTGTPTLIVNGKQFTGDSIDDLIKMAEEAAK